MSRRSHWFATLGATLAVAPFLHADDRPVLYRAVGIGYLSKIIPSSDAYSISQNGFITGDSKADNHYSHAHVALVGESLLDIGDLPGGGEFGTGADVNLHGHVCGYSTGTNAGGAFLWTPEDGMLYLGDLPGGSRFSTGRALNDLDHVTGYSVAEGGDTAFIWTREGGMIGLGDFPGLDLHSEAYDINNAGQVVGNGSSYRSWIEAFVWDAQNGLQPLPDCPDGTIAQTADGINELGQICGWTTHAEGYLWDPLEGYTLLGKFAGGGGLNYTLAYDLNNKGQIVGLAQLDRGIPPFGWIWDRDHGLRKIADLLDAGTKEKYRDILSGESINDRGQIVVNVPYANEGVVLFPFVLGDMNCDASVDVFDVEPFVLALVDLEAHAAAFPDCHGDWAGDINQDGSFNGFDVDAFVDILTGGG